MLSLFDCALAPPSEQTCSIKDSRGHKFLYSINVTLTLTKRIVFYVTLHVTLAIIQYRDSLEICEILTSKVYAHCTYVFDILTPKSHNQNTQIELGQRGRPHDTGMTFIPERVHST